MSTVIDELVVRLGLDNSEFAAGEKKQREGTKRVKDDAATAGKEMEASGKRAAGFFKSLRTEVLGVLAAFAGASGLKSFTSALIENDANVYRLSKNLGLAVNDLSAWEGALKSVGGSAQDADNAFRLLVSAKQDYELTGSTGHDADMYGLGIVPGDLNHPLDLMNKLAAASERMTRPEFLARMQRIGFSESTITLLAKGRAGLEGVIIEQHKLGAATEASGAAAVNFERALSNFVRVVQDMARPVLTWLLEAFGDLATNHLPVLVGVMVGLAGAAVAVGVALVGWPIAATVAGIIAIGAAVGALSEMMGTSEQHARRWARTLIALDQIRHGDFSGAYKTWNTDEGAFGPHAAAVAADMAATGGGVSPGGGSIGSRNNPGNIRGAGGKGFATYATPEAGLSAMSGLLRRYQTQHGLSTVRGIVSRWAPPSENNTAAYIAAVSRRTGFGADQTLNLGDPATMAKLEAAMIQQEHGRQPFSQAQLLAGAGGTLTTARGARSGGTGNLTKDATAAGNTSTTTIGTIVVHTKATDGEGVARDLPAALRRRTLGAQAATGLAG